MTRSIFCLLACLAVTACSTPTSTVIVPQGAAVPHGGGCVDGLGVMQSGTDLCVGYSG